MIEGIGGDNGWYSFPLAWAVRGCSTGSSGGVGLRRGRRDPTGCCVGDALDFWRVEEIEPDASCCGCAPRCGCPGWPGWSSACGPATPARRTTYGSGRSSTRAGCSGHVYWWAVAPFHGIVFGGMARNIARAAQQLDEQHPAPEEAPVGTYDVRCCES